MTKAIVVTNTSNYENEDWAIWVVPRPGTLTIADVKKPTIIAPGESATFHRESEFYLKIHPLENGQAEAKHVDHAGWNVQVTGTPRTPDLTPLT